MPSAELTREQIERFIADVEFVRKANIHMGVNPFEAIEIAKLALRALPPAAPEEA